MNIVIAFVVLFSCMSFYAHAVCETYSKTCTISIGQHLPYSENLNYAYLSADEDFYLTFSMPLDTQSVYMDLSVLFGTVRIYAALNRKPSPTDFDYTNALTGQQEYLSMVSTSHKVSDQFNVLIKASPSSAAQFTGSVIAANKPVVMDINGMPQAAHMGRGSLQLFRFSAQSTAPINVIATGYSSYMPVMTLVYYPIVNGPAAAPPNDYFNNDSDPNNHYLSFTPKTSDIGKVFEVQLHAVNMSSLSLVVRVAAGVDGEVIAGTPAQDPPVAGAPTHTVVLQSGHPQRDLVGVQQEHYYVFYVPPDITGTISINVDPLQGDSDLFVNPSSRGFYHHGGGDPLSTWSSMRASGIDSVAIRKEDRDYLHNGGAYYITVFGYDAAQFLIRVNAQDAATVLVEGYSLQDTVSKGSYKYYRFQDSDPLHSVYFDLLPTVGDADLMVGCILRPTGDDNGYPSKLSGHYNYSSQMYLEDTVVVSPSDTKSCSLGANADSSAHRGEGGIFYLAVYGYSDATFMISAQHAFGERTLVDGLPVSAVVYRLVPQRFKIRVGFQAEELRLRLTPLFGDADLYASLNHPPDMSNYDFQSNNFNSEVDTILISEDKICANCWVHILVYGFVTTEFTLLASFSDGTVVLGNGVPQRGSVASSAVEYYNYLTTADCSVTVVITASNGLVPTLYMSKSIERPNSTTPDTVIRKADSGIGVLPKVVLPGILAGSSVHIGVAGAGRNITYSIRVHETASATAAPPTLLTLVYGAPQEDSIPADSATGWLYYQVNAPIGHETIRLRTVMEVGFVELYVSKCTTSTYQCASTGLPSETNYLLTTADTDRDFLNIYRNDDVPMIYIVGVLSRSYYSVYQLSAGFESSALSLQAGVAVMDHVNKNEIDYFSFYMDQSYVKLKISITTVSGDPDLFVSTTVERPAADDRNSTWRSTEFGSDVLTIDPQLDPRACVHCTYYIAVVGRQESTYTIAASTTSNLPKLVDGVPTAGSIAQGEWTYYSFQNAYGSSRDLHVGLTSATGNADLYVTLDGTIPSFTGSQYSSANWFSNDGVDILHSDTAYSTSCSSSAGTSDCVVILGVYGFTHSEYTLVLTSSSAATLLQLGVVQSSSVAQAQNKNYRVLLSAGGSLSPYTLRFSVTPLSGHVRLFVSCDNFQPNSTSHQWAMTPTPGSGSTLDIMSVAAVDKGCLKTGAQYYAAVYGDSASSFTISASLVNSTAVPLLIPGFSHAGLLATHSFDYFFLRPGATFENIRLLATVLQGDVDVYVSASWDKRPQYSATAGRVQSYLLSSAKFGSEDMILSHDWVQDVCDKRDSCYLIVGVMGTVSSSRYNILSSSQDATLQLSAGVPRHSHVNQGRLEYFKFTLSQPDLDVIVSVTPISGDPDLFIGMQPLTHPSRDNYTWFQSKFGADSITLQYREISQHCVPRPLITGGDCDIYIGVFGWMNTSFTIMAAADEGFRSPVTLIDQNPQSGFVGAAAYTYYSYAVSVPPGGSGSPPVNIKFTLTPTDDGDADLFLLIQPNGNKTEPGLTNYNYRSVGWGSVTEVIELSADMPFYCFDCTVYLAVYGYRPCAYSIQASSSGLVALQAGHAMGGHVNSENFAYYTIHNANQFGLMKFTLTMISEDADLYILPHKPDTPFALPTRTHYQWRSLFVGSDVVSLTYEDPHYCADCDYIIGVYGYANSTYTLMVTDQEDGIVKLVQNRPQIAAIGAKDGMLYFSSVVASSYSDMTVTLTSLDTGYADLYVQVYNASVFNSAAGGDVYRLPDPDVPSSFSYTTHGSEDDHVFIRGPHKHESVVVVAVRALRAVRFSIVVTSSQTPVLLLAGVPQSHYVEFGMNEYFKFYPHADEDLHITLTARSGDPDLLVSASSSTPHCARVATTYYTSTVCSNFTWSSRSYMTDQLIISRDSPCSAVMPGTTVATDCDPERSFIPHSGAPVFIGVYGYSAAQFNLLVAPVGQQLQLLAGQPQQSRTSSGYICSSRSPTNGACITPSSANKKVEVAYFAFRVPFSSSDNGKKRSFLSADLGTFDATSSVRSVFDVIFTVVPSCNSSRLPDDSATGKECAPGCDCAPLIAYINSCPLSRCSQVDRKPSELLDQHKIAHIVKAGTGSTIFLSSAGAGGTSSLCDPAVAGEDCGYFVAVVASPLPSMTPNSAPRLESAVFTITARTPGDMTLIPCVAADTGAPDGIQFFGEDSINLVVGTGGKQQRGNGPTHHYYELCSQQYAPGPSAQTTSESLVVELEQCAGLTSLYACADSGHCANAVPTQQSWGYFSDETQTCVHSWEPWGRDTCISVVRNRPSLSLPQRLGNYFLMANGSGKFEMRVQTTVGGVKVAPQVVFAGMQSVDSARVKVLDVTGNTVRMQWQQARVLMPGLYIPLEADYMTYSAYIFDAKLTDAALRTLQISQGVENVRLSTLCGLNYAVEVLPVNAVKVERAKLKSVDQGADFMTDTFEGLSVNTQYRLVLVAACDSTCLRQLSKVTNNPRISISCSDKAGDCKPQSVVYISGFFTTAATADDVSHDDVPSSGDNSYVQSLINFSIVVMVLLGIALIGVVAYWVKYNGKETWAVASAWLHNNIGGGGTGASWEGEDRADMNSARSSHGLVSSDSSSTTNRQFSGLSALSKVKFGKGNKADSSNSSNQEGVELETVSYAPPSISGRDNHSSDRRPLTAMDPIDFRGGSTVESVSEAMSGAAARIYSTVAGTTAVNPVHSALQEKRRTSTAEYVGLPTIAAAENGQSAADEVELHL